MDHRYSTVSQYTRCPRLYKLIQLDKKPEPGPRPAVLEFGTAMHLGVESELRGGNGEETFTIYWQSVKGLEMAYDREGWDTLLNTGQTLLNRFRRLHADRFTPKYLEEPMSALMRNMSVIGTPDFVGDFDGVPSLVDFKTTAYAYHKGRIKAGDQLPVYVELVRLAKGYQAKQKVYFQFVKGTKPQITVQVKPVDPVEQARAIDNFVLLCKRIEQETEFPQYRGACVIGRHTCQMFGECHGSLKD